MAAAPGLLLTLSIEADRLLVLLTDFGQSTTLHGWAPAAWAELRRAIAAREPVAALTRLALPPAVRDALAGQSQRALAVRLPAELAGLPIEAFEDAGGAWRARFAIARQVIEASASTVAAAVPPSPARPPAPALEHRPVSALSFDVVGSTALMEALGSEAYSEMLGVLHQRCLACVQARGGLAFERQGDDGSMAFFGMPHALEDAAERAAEAALAMQAALPDLPGQPRLRIGIASGRVATRDGVPYGPCVHLAARLRALGQPGDTVVDDPSRWQARHRFEFGAAWECAAMAGIPGPVYAAHLHGRRGEAPAAAASWLTPLVGREAECAALWLHWMRACGGGPVVVCLRGEAGIGKTRLVRELQRRIAAEGHLALEIRGLPESQGTAFRSLTEALRSGFGIGADTDPRQARQAIAAGTRLPPAALDGLMRSAALLGLPQAGPDPDTLEGEAQGRARERLFLTLTEVVAAAATDHPLALIVEDLQWIDPSTLEALQQLVAALAPRADLRLLLVCTQRDDHDDLAPPGAAPLELPRLHPQAARSLVLGAGGAALPPEWIDRLIERAEGVPLFLEESARMAAEAGPGSAVRPGDVPDSLHGLIMARLDRLGAAGLRLVQVAAVLGREFAPALLDALLAEPLLAAAVPDAPGRLAALERGGILRRFGNGAAARLGFRHEMLRDVAYLSLWQRDRAELHAAVARVLGRDFAAMVDERPDWLARHLAEAGRHADAVAQWERAARTAAAGSANREAIAHLRAALASLAHLPMSATTEALSLRLRLMLAARLIAADGYGAEEVARLYEHCADLAARLGDADAEHKVRLGRESVHVMRGELDRAAALATEALAEAARRPAGDGERAPLLQARWALAHVLFHAGDSASALPLFDQCLAEYRPAPGRRSAVQDPAVMCLCYGAWALWEQGHADRAWRRIEEALALARALEHRFSEAEACGFAASLALFRGEAEVALPWADQAVALCEDAGFSVWLAHARLIRGRLRALRGAGLAALDEMEAGYRAWVATGAVITRPFYLALMAETELEGGALDAAAQRLAEALAIVARSGERYHEAELLRLAGRLAHARGQQRRGDALLRRALATARAQGKLAFALRAATALGEAWAARGRVRDAAALLDGALAPLVEGHDTQDLRRALALRAAWAPATARRRTTAVRRSAPTTQEEP